MAGLVPVFRHRIRLLGLLPGGLVVRRHRFALDFPLAISVIFSVILPAIRWLWRT